MEAGGCGAAAQDDEDDFREPRGRRPGAEEKPPPAAASGRAPPPPPPPRGQGGPKRKAAASSGAEPLAQKRRRAGEAEEELRLALALSRSLHQAGRLRRAAPPGRRKPRQRGGKKSRVMPPCSPPTLLLQDPEKARRQTEERVALLLSEVDEFPSTPPLPPSRLLESELPGEADWPVAVPKGPPSSLWERSSLVGPVCAAGSTLSALPRQTDQINALPLPGSVTPEAEEILPQGRGEGPQEGRQDAEGCSQKEAGALQDLMELAGEGLTLTQWNPPAPPGEEREQEWVPGNIPRSSLDWSLEKKPPPLGSCSPPLLLGSLAAAFKGMVNNPHLSDVQFQVESGELFYAHLFVLYARCPRLMEVVDEKGFWVAEEGEVETRRVLLSGVSGEAAQVFLNYLYTAEHVVPPQVLPDVAALAARFGLAELAALCRTHGWGGQPSVAASGQEEEVRAEKFEELLKSLWGGEEDEDGASLPEEPGSEGLVDEQELQEIYEFAATQREAEEGHCSAAMAGACPAEEGAMPGDSLVGKGSLGLALSRLQVQGARKEAVPGPPLESPQRPLGATNRRGPEGLPKALREPAERSLLAVSPGGGTVERCQQSPNGRGPGDDAAGGGGAGFEPSTPLGPEEGPLLVSGSFSRTDELLASPKQRGGFCSHLSLSLFSPAPEEASGRRASSETAAVSGADTSRDAPPSPLPSSPSPVDQEGAPMLTLYPGDEGELGQGKQPVKRSGCPPKEREVFGGMNCHRSLEGDVARGQGTGASAQGTHPGSKADASGGRTLVPGAPLLSCRRPEDGQVAKRGPHAGPEVQQPGDAQDSPPSQEPATVLSPKRLSLQGHHCPSPRSSACLLSDGRSAADVVVILDDSEEEAEVAAWQSWGSSVLEVDLPVPEHERGPLVQVASLEGSGASEPGSCQWNGPPGSLLMRNGTPPGGSHAAGRARWPRLGSAEEGSSSSSAGSRSGRLDFQDKGDEMEVLPLTQRLSAPVPVSKTPDVVCQEKEGPGTTPPTPMPSYSIMETPVLKKELSRFGVRTLPKKQMVRKLKEIFQYTHHRSDSRDESTSSQLGSCHGNQVALRRLTSAAAHSGFPKQQPGCPDRPQVLLAVGRCGGSSVAGNQEKRQGTKQGCLPASSRRRKRAVEGPVRDGQALVASQKAGGLLGTARDTSVILQSSSSEFETSVLAAAEDDTPASQSSCREADTLVALRQYIRARPALCRQILLYHPFELARLQSELKQNGVRVALGRLLEFLDAHCITFTTAEARRDKRQQNGRLGRRRY